MTKQPETILDKTACINKSGQAYGAWYWARPGKFNEQPKKNRVAFILEYRKYRELAKTAPPERNDRGNIVHRDGEALAMLGIAGRPENRYFFDFKICTKDRGWLQYDTDQDASYYGQWCHPEKLQFVSYCEGDVTLVICENAAQYNKELARMNEFHEIQPPAITAIDEHGKVTHYYDERPQFLEVKE